MGSSVILDRSIFPSQDIRYSGSGARPKVKKEVKMAPGFLKPKVPMPGSAVPGVNEGNVFLEEGSEAMDEGQDNVVPLAAGSRAVLCSCEGIPCSCGGFVCKAVGEDFVCPHEIGDDKGQDVVVENPERRVVLVENPERRVVAYTPPHDRGSLFIKTFYIPVL